MDKRVSHRLETVMDQGHSEDSTHGTSPEKGAPGGKNWVNRDLGLSD